MIIEEFNFFSMVENNLKLKVDSFFTMTDINGIIKFYKFHIIV